jgi:hypothetical protein
MYDPTFNNKAMQPYSWHGGKSLHTVDRAMKQNV